MPKQSSKGYTAPTAASAVAQAGEGGAFPQPLSTADMDATQPFAHLVRLLGRCFYNDVVIRDGVVITDGDDDNCGLAVTILDNLTRFAWVKENELAKMLNTKQKNMIVLLQFLEKEKLLKRELVKRAQVKTIDAVAKKENGTFNMLAGAYCCLDYSRVVDVTRYQLDRMKESFKEKPDCSTMIEDYMCCICKRSYSALDAVHLISNTGNTFRCESCKGELVAQSGDYTSRRESRAKSANMLIKSLKHQQER
ncbi:general transcription factor IIE subunit 1-like [Panicum hallii]|uniref:general transcription factor IIE subunit 1-like n=1 Tax=Panicum hallii TaxID=206008 RepID=UPI000DF4CAA5|nr:general transcription factor IIE subunit 1-like [Panicum hallii]